MFIDGLQRRTTQALVSMLREGRLKSEEEFKVLGANLYRVLFENKVGEAVTDALYQPLKLVRVELEFEEGQEILSSWPWEYLFVRRNTDMQAPVISSQDKKNWS